MGTDSQAVLQTVLQLNMAKLICLLTWAGLALTAPQRLRSSVVDNSGLVDTILAQLDSPINQAIEAALNGLYSKQVPFSAPVLTSFTGTVSKSPAITVETSGTISSNFDDDDFEGSAFSSSNEGQFNGFSTSGGQSSSFASNSFSEDSSSFFSSNSFQTSEQSSGQTS